MLWTLASVALAIVLYGLLMMSIHGPTFSKNDVMNRRLFTIRIFGEKCCSLWPLTHFVLFFVIGMVYPNCFWYAMAAGIIWELIEGMTPALPVVGPLADSLEYPDWWKPSPKDILFNAAGFLAALAYGRI